MYCTKTVKAPLKSPPSRGAWIEIVKVYDSNLSVAVAPLAGGVD